MSKALAGLAARIERNWYGSVLGNLWLLPLWPLVWVVVHLRRRQFLRNPPPANTVPVVVVGNITVGGTGKTPLITLLAERAQALGLHPAVVSRGYGGKATRYPLLLTADTPVEHSGDEPRLLFNRLNAGASLCPVVVDPERRRAVAELAGQADIIFSDDGLQHYAMARAAEIVVVDHARGFGNGWLLPLGPLREPLSRLKTVDLVVRNGDDFQVQPTALVSAVSGEQIALQSFSGREVVAVSGIGNPQRFYDSLRSLGMQPREHSFADHHQFQPDDLAFHDQNPDLPLVMTEKDWVKCRHFAQPDWWYLQVSAVPEPALLAQLDSLLMTWSGKTHG
jgi:tetraacyldisaccharide 4'-kinase